MKKVVVGVIKLIVLNIALNIVISLIRHFTQIEITEWMAYIIYLVKNSIIIYVGIKIFWKDLDLDTVKKIVLTFMIITIIYNVFDVAKSIIEYEESLSTQFSNEPIQYDETLTERERKQIDEVRETLRKAGENLQKYLKEHREEYYVQSIRAYIVVYSIILIGLYCFVAPKWFEVQKAKEQKNPTFDFYKE